MQKENMMDRKESDKKIFGGTQDWMELCRNSKKQNTVYHLRCNSR